MTDGFPPGDDWIPITQASTLLHKRYLKTRDLAFQGKLGEVHRTSSNRQYVRQADVEKYIASQASD